MSRERAGEGPGVGGRAVEQVPPARREALGRLLDRLSDARDVVLTTHVNADGDGTGSQAALAAWLLGRGRRVLVVNPTPFPQQYRFLFRDDPVLGDRVILDAAEPEGRRALAACDLLFVVDTGERKRIGRAEKALRPDAVAILDHHPPGPDPIQGVGLVDPAAAATGELVHDLLVLGAERASEAGTPEPPWSRGVLEGIYTALVTDTGSFRYSNTSPRCHRIAARLLAAGVDPERIFRLIYANASLSQLRLLGLALERLQVDAEHGIAWTTLDRETLAAAGDGSRDFDSILEQTRSVRGTELALLFREVDDGSTKVSFRSGGDLDVNALAREFGGGGHVKASGAVVGAPPSQVVERVLGAARTALDALEANRAGE